MRCRLALYLGRQSHKPDPTNPGTDCVQCHAQGKDQVTFQRVFAYVECTGEGSGDFSEGFCVCGMHRGRVG